MIYLFRSDKDREVFGFTADLAGTNLPADFAPWRRAGKGAAISTGDGKVGIGLSEQIRATVEGEGYYIARS
jgi:hypothetical protein